MDFGRVEDPRQRDRIDWSLPSLESAEERAQLERLARAAARDPRPPRLRVGMPVWGEAAWIGRLYPKGSKGTETLREYARHFDTVEINSTFYAVPPRATFARWRDAVPEHFRFCPKLPQSVSRSVAGTLVTRELEAFVSGALELGDRLGQCFVQLPPAASPACLGELDALLSAIPRALRIAVELRHEGFFRERRLRPEIVDFLARHRAAAVITDTAGFRELAHASLSSTRALVRFASSDDPAIDDRRLRDWAARIATWFASGLRELDVTLHAKDPLAQLTMARSLSTHMNEALASRGLPLSVPVLETIDERQRALF